jgi:hypothetical protein
VVKCFKFFIDLQITESYFFSGLSQSDEDISFRYFNEALKRSLPACYYFYGYGFGLFNGRGAVTKENIKIEFGLEIFELVKLISIK